MFIVYNEIFGYVSQRKISITLNRVINEADVRSQIMTTGKEREREMSFAGLDRC